MGGTLLTGPSIRRFGARGHTVASTMSSACSAVVLGHATSNAIAFSGVVPMALGAGKSQATSARITNLGEELGIPQGQLAAERNTLNAIIKVIGHFALGSLRWAHSASELWDYLFIRPPSCTPAPRSWPCLSQPRCGPRMRDRRWCVTRLERKHGYSCARAVESSSSMRRAA